MSNTIDEKVVSMKFNNAQFEAKVKATLDTLSMLKQSLKLDGARKGLEDLDAAGKKFSLEHIGQATDKLAEKFNTLSVIGISALATLTSKATELGLQMMSNFTDSMTSGFNEYETKLNSVQTILANTESKGTDLKDVNRTLSELNEYSDKTIYNFGEMARNIGMFTAAGVGLKDSTASIKGIANLAAVSGSNAQQASTAMYQLSQAISSGTVRLMDWNSVQNAGMGGEVFKTALIRTAKVHGVAVDDMIKKNGSFRDSLVEGWLTADIMTETLAQFTGDLSDEQLKNMGYTKSQIKEIQRLAATAQDAATKVKTFTQLMGTLSEAAGSGWAESWQIIVGDFEEARTFYTEVNDIASKMIGDSAKARNEQLQIWKDAGGRTAIIDSLRNTFEALMQVITPIGEAFREVFPPTLGKTLASMSFALRDFTESLKIGEEGSANVKIAAKGLFTVLKFGTDILGGLVGMLGVGMSYLRRFAGVIAGFIFPVTRFFSEILTGGESAEGAVNGLEVFFGLLKIAEQQILEPVISTLEQAAAAFDSFLNGGDLAARFHEQLAPILDFFTSLKDAVLSGLAKAVTDLGASFSAAWAGLENMVRGVWEFVVGVAKAIGDIFGGIGDGIADGFSSLNVETILNILNTGIFAAIVIAITKFVRSGSGAVDGIAQALEGLTDTLKAMQSGLKAQALMHIAAGIAILAAAVLILSLVDPARLIESVSALGVLAAELLGTMYLFSKIAGADGVSKMLIISGALILFGAALGTLANSVRKLGELDSAQLEQGLVAVTILLSELLIVAAAMSKIGGGFVQSASSLGLLAGALLIMSSVVAIFSNMSWEQMGKGFAALTGLLALVVGTAVILTKFASQMGSAAIGLLAMAGAIGMLTSVVITFGLVPIPVLTQGMIAVGILVGALVAAGVLLSKFAPQMSLAAAGMMAMSAAVGMLVGSIVILGMLPMEVLIQGMVSVGVAMLALAVAANFMVTALPGAAAMLAVAASMLILAFAVQMLGSMSLEQLGIALLALAGTLAVIGIAAALLTPVIPVFLSLAAGLALMGAAMLAVGAGMFFFSLGVAVLGPALGLLAQGLSLFGTYAGEIGLSIPLLLGVGAALLVLGAGAVVGGAGLILLGVGLAVTAAGLLALGFASIMGITGLTSFVLGMSRLAPMIPDILAMGASLLVMGAGALAAGAGLLALGVGAMTVAVALLLLNAAGTSSAESIGKIVTAFTDLVWQVPAMITVGGGLLALGGGAAAAGAGVLLLGTAALVMAGALLVLSSGASITVAAVSTLVTALATLAPLTPMMGALNVAIFALAASLTVLGASAAIVGAGLLVASSGAVAIGAASIVAAAGVMTMGGALGTVAPIAASAISKTVSIVGSGVDETLSLLSKFEEGVNKMVPSVVKSGTRAVKTFGEAMRSEIKNQATAVGNSAEAIGKAIVDGMARGIRNNKSRVSAEARSVAADALRAAKAELGVESPSKEFEKVGKWSDEGLANGFDKNAGIVSDSAADIGKTAISSLKKALAGVSTAVSGEMDMAPSIRPVLDLSDVRKSAALISGIFGRQSLPIGDTYAMAAGISTSQRAAVPTDLAPSAAPVGPKTEINYTQYNTSPKALSSVEIYRQTRNQLSTLKGALST